MLKGISKHRLEKNVLLSWMIDRTLAVGNNINNLVYVKSSGAESARCKDILLICLADQSRV